MLRGKRKIKAITAVMATSEQEDIISPKESRSLYDEKVKLLTARYYYYNNKLKNYEKVLQMLEKEFFISTGRIADIIAKQIPVLHALRDQAPKREWFKTNWRHLTW